MNARPRSAATREVSPISSAAYGLSRSRRWATTSRTARIRSSRWARVPPALAASCAWAIAPVKIREASRRYASSLFLTYW